MLKLKKKLIHLSFFFNFIYNFLYTLNCCLYSIFCLFLINNFKWQLVIGYCYKFIFFSYNFFLLNNFVLKIWLKLKNIYFLGYFQSSFISQWSKLYTVLRSPFIYSSSKEHFLFKNIFFIFFIRIEKVSILVINYIDFFFNNCLSISLYLKNWIKKIIFIKNKHEI